MSLIQYPVSQSPNNVTYSANDFLNYINPAFTNNDGDGVVYNIDNEMVVSPSSPAAQSIQVGTGACWLNGQLVRYGTAQTLAVSPNTSGTPRIDLVVASFVDADAPNQGQLKIVQGTPASSPSPPTAIENPGTEYQIVLAELYLTSGFTTIDANDIRDRRVYSNQLSAPRLLFVNNAGSPIEKGQPVKLDTSQDQTVAVCDSVDDAIIGVAANYIRSSGYIITEGLGYVQTTSSVTRGIVLGPSSTTGQASPSAYKHGFAMALESGTMPLSYIQCGAIRKDILDRVISTVKTATVTATQTTTSGTFANIPGLSITFTKRNIASQSTLVCTLIANGGNTGGIEVPIIRIWNNTDSTVIGLQRRIAFEENSGIAIGSAALAAGTYTITGQFAEAGLDGSFGATVANCILMVQEVLLGD